MRGKRELILLLFIASLCAISYASDIVVERPIYSSGDYWIFIGEKGRSSKLEFLREEKDKYVFRKDGTEVVKDFSLMDVSKSGFPGPIVKFPLKIGKWWNHEFAVETQKTGTGRGQRIARYEATDYEKITVPAGTFEAFKITVTIEALVSHKQGSKTVGSVTYWYAPSIKQIIKAEKGELLWELKDYKIK